MVSMSIWKDKIVLRTDLLTLNRHPELVDHARYNEKFQAYLLTFSAQNLIRIRQAFGEIPVSSGLERINSLRLKFSEYMSMCKTAQEIKDAASLPDLEYKMPPLGLYQHRGVHLLTRVPRVPLFADCGVGKTFMAIVSTEYHIKEGTLSPGETLVCGKLATLETGWLEDVKKFSNLKANLLWLPGTSKRKEKLLKILDDPADIYITNHNTLTVLEDALAAKRFKKIIVDESTVLKSYHGDFTRKGGSLGKALMRIAEHAEWRVIMSGTPAPNGPHDLWGQFRFIDPDGFTLEASYQDFKERYMEEIFFGKADGPETPSTWVNRPESIKEVGDKIAPLSYQIKIRDHLHDLPEKTVIRRSIPMGEDQQKHYLDMREKLATIINDEFVAIDVKLAQLSKLRQITGGFLIDQEEEVHPIEDATKLEAMDDLLEEIGDYKVVIYAQFQWEIKTLAERYKERGVVTVFGANRSQDNLANIKAFINNPDVKVIILHPKSAAHGVTFTVSHYMIFYSISFSAEDDYQCVARIERASQRHPMFIYYLIAKMNGAKKHRDEEKKEVTIDEIIYQVLQKKTRDQNQLLDQRVIDMEILKQV